MLVTCSKCKKEKPVEEFYINARKQNGYSSRCKQCLRDATNLAWKNHVKEKKKVKFPKYHCDKCGAITKLDFDPAKEFARWSFFNCPNCNPSEKI